MKKRVVPETVPQLLQQGVASAKAGDKIQARRFLGQVIELDPNHEIAWIWLAGIAETPQEAGVYLERVLEINPANERARTGLKWVRARQAQAEADPQPAAAPVSAPAQDQPAAHLPPAPQAAQSALPPAEPPAQAPLPSAPQPVNAATQPAPPVAEASARVDPSSSALRAEPEAVVTPPPAPPRPPVEARPQPARPAAPPRPAPARRGTILIVDDSPTVRKLVAITLERSGYQVVAAANGVEALAAIQDHAPDLIFLDISMPRMDGYQVCKLVRSDPVTKNLPVILLSGKDGFFDKVKGRMAGSSEYMTKPFEPEALLEAVAKYILAGSSQ